MTRRIKTLADRWVAGRLTYQGMLTNWLLLFVTASGLIAALPGAILDWGLFAAMAAVFVIEGEVMRRKVVRRKADTGFPPEPQIAIIIAVRYALGAYFLFAVARVLFDPERTWPDLIAYEARAFVVAWLVLEVLVIPYANRMEGSVVGMLVDDIDAGARRTSDANDARDSRRDLERDVGRDIDRDLDRDIIRDPQRDLAHDAKTTNQRDVTTIVPTRTDEHPHDEENQPW